MKKSQKIILIIILIIIILVCIPVISYFYHFLKFEHNLKNNSFIKNEQGTYFNNTTPYYQGIDILDTFVFDDPDFLYTSYSLPISYYIEFYDLNDHSQNKIYFTSDYFHLSPGKKSTLEELKDEINKTHDVYYINGESVSKEQWKEATTEFVSDIENNYNKVINMLK